MLYPSCWDDDLIIASWRVVFFAGGWAASLIVRITQEAAVLSDAIASGWPAFVKGRPAEKHLRLSLSLSRRDGYVWIEEKNLPRNEGESTAPGHHPYDHVKLSF